MFDFISGYSMSRLQTLMEYMYIVNDLNESVFFENGSVSYENIFSVFLRTIVKIILKVLLSLNGNKLNWNFKVLNTDDTELVAL